MNGTISLAVVAYHGFCLVVPRWNRVSFREAGLTKDNFRLWLPWSVLVSAILILLGIFAGPWIFRQFAFPLSEVLPPDLPFAAFAIYSLLVNPLLEEYFWRGFVLGKLGIWLSALFFGLMHFAVLMVLLSWPQAVLAGVGTFIAGFVWGWMKQRFNNLWPCVLTHLAADAAILYVMRVSR